MNVPVYIAGGPGNDRLYAGLNGAVLDGGPGRDYLYGSVWGDILIGGADRDYAFGRGGDDVVIGGAHANSVDQLMGALEDWNSNAPYADRVSDLAAVLSIADDNARDLLLGQVGRDVFYDGHQDRMLGRRRNEDVV